MKTLLLVSLSLLPQAGGGFKPTECYDNQCMVDPADARVGRSVTYLMDASGSKVTTIVAVVGKSGDDWLVEHWMDLGTISYGFLFRLGADKKIVKAWAAAKGDTAWTPIAVRKAPNIVAGDAPKPVVQESEEKKETKAGALECKRLEVKVTVQGKVYVSNCWYSKRVWKFYAGCEHGGMVAMEASGARTTLDKMVEDAKPTLPLPKD